MSNEASAVSDAELLAQVREVAVGLQRALERFHLVTRQLAPMPGEPAGAGAHLERLARQSEDASQQTMDLVEQCCPLTDQVSREAERLMALNDTAELAQTLRPQMAAFLQLSACSMPLVRGKLAEMLLAHGYQDRGTQIVRSTVALVGELEPMIAALVRIAGRLAGQLECAEPAAAGEAAAPDAAAATARVPAQDESDQTGAAGPALQSRVSGVRQS